MPTFFSFCFGFSNQIIITFLLVLPLIFGMDFWIELQWNLSKPFLCTEKNDFERIEMKKKTFREEKQVNYSFKII